MTENPGEIRPLRPAIFFAALLVMLWSGIALFASWGQDFIDMPYEIPPSGGMGNPTVTGTNPWVGMCRWLVLVTWSVGVGGVALLPKFSFAWKWLAGRPSRSMTVAAAACFPLVMSGVNTRLPEITSGAFLLAFLGGLIPLFLTNAPRKTAFLRPRVWVLIAATGYCCLGFVRTGLTLGCPFETTWVLPVLAVLGVIVLSAYPGRVRSSGIPGTVCWFTLLGAAGTFAGWPGKAAALWWAGLALPLLIWAGRSRPWKSRNLRLLWVAVTLATIGLSGEMPFRPVDPHHEAESLFPGHWLMEGKLPYRDFVPFHGIGIDCLPPALATPLWGLNLFGARLVRSFLAAPLRGLLLWLIVQELFWLPAALVFWGILAFGPDPGGWATNDSFRLEPALVAIWLFLRFRKRERSDPHDAGSGPAAPGWRSSAGPDPHDAGSGPAAPGWRSSAGLIRDLCGAGLASLAAAFLTPELGMPLCAAWGVTCLMGMTGDDPERRRAMIAGGVFVTFGAGLLFAAMYGSGMAWGFISALRFSTQMMTELVARWNEQNISNYMTCVGAAVTSLLVLALLRECLASGQANPHPSHALARCRSLAFFLILLLPGMFAAFSDEPMRLIRSLPLTIIALATLFRIRGGRMAFPGIIVVLSVLTPLLGSPWLKFTTGSAPPREWKYVQDEKLGAGWLPEAQIRDLDELYRWGADRVFFEASNSSLGSYLLGMPLPMNYVPLHYGYLPREQQRLCRWLRERAPSHLLIRTDQDEAFWKIAPYPLIFHLLTAEILG